MNMKAVKLKKIITIATIAIVLIMTFIPFYRVDHFTGKDGVTGRPIYTYEYRSFFLRLFYYMGDIRRSSFFFGLVIIVFYLSAILSIVYLLLDKKIRFNISLLFGGICMTILIFTDSYISVFSVIVASVYFALLLGSVVLDVFTNNNFSKTEEKAKKAESKRIGMLVKNKRKELGLTQKELADRSFMSRSLVSKIELGEVSLNGNHLKSLAAALDVDINYFDANLNDDFKKTVEHDM